MNRLTVQLVSVLISFCTIVSAEEKEKSSPLKVTLELNDDLIPNVELKNISDAEVAVCVNNAKYSFKFSVTPDQKKSPFEDYGPQFSNFDNLQIERLKPGESRHLKLEQLCGFLSVVKGEFKVEVTYSVHDKIAADVDEVTRKVLWQGSVTSEPVTLKINRPVIGVGKIENPAEWAKKHQFTGPLLVGGSDHSKETLRLWTPGLAAGDCSSIAAMPPWQIRENFLPKGWMALSCEYVVPVLFKNTGIGFLYPWHYESEAQRKEFATKKVESRKYEWLRPYGLTEELEGKITDHHDFEWLRDLDGARIRYRVVDNPKFGALFEVWDEEFDAAKPEMDEFINLSIKIFQK